MKLIIKAQPNAKKPSITKTVDGILVVAIKEPAEQDRANRAIVKAVAQYFGVAQSRIKILLGRTARQKIIEIK